MVLTNFRYRTYAILLALTLLFIPQSGVIGQPDSIQSIDEYQNIIIGSWRNNPKQALALSRAAIAFADKSGDKRSKAIAMRLFGGTFYYMGAYDSALHYSKKALLASQISGDSTLIASSLSNIGLNYVQMGVYPDGLENLLHAYNIKKRINQTYAIGLTLNNIGLVYTKLKDYQKAREYLIKAMEVSDRYGDFDAKLYATNNLGTTYLYTHELDQAEKYFKQSLDIVENINNKSWESAAYSGYGQVYLERGVFEKARPLFQKSLGLYEELDDKVGISEAYYLLSKYFVKLGNRDSALYYVNKSKSFAKETTSKERKLDNYELLEDLFKQEGKYDSAWHYKTKWVNLRDSTFNEGMARTLSNLELKIAEDEANKKLASKDFLIDKKTKQNYYLIGFVFIVLAFSFMLYVLYKRQAQLSHDLAQKNQEIVNQKEEIQVQKEALYDSNQKLDKARIQIEKQNMELAQYNSQLKSLVDRRTEELAKANTELKEANLELDDFIYKSSHDIKGPLVRLLGVCNVAMLDIKDKTSRGYFEMFHSAATYLNNLFDKLKLINDINYAENNITNVNLSELVQNVFKRLKALPECIDINIKVDVDSSLSIKSNAFLIETILSNLLENSIQFQKLDNTEKLISLKAALKGQKVHIKVADNGLGISQKDLDYIFKMFSKAALQHKNVGMGLYIVKLCLKKIDGEIQLNHSSPEGTEFELIV